MYVYALCSTCGNPDCALLPSGFACLLFHASKYHKLAIRAPEDVVGLSPLQGLCMEGGTREKGRERGGRGKEIRKVSYIVQCSH